MQTYRYCTYIQLPGHISDSRVSTPVFGFVPEAIAQSALCASFRKATSVQSLPVILMFFMPALVTCGSTRTAGYNSSKTCQVATHREVTEAT